ncbi:GIY-YIG nuclease family protein [Caldibacillus lycopersici]|uniref:GIY-YIG nuclease family protein n=1 Tax=Perspicuibacillus lycopersici TaxID=1325689 RepID=A0AAE3IXQ8_9BACI|nr:GIY-YIG nuclease family protein [Perspicuibacillus lycopersici]MCU9615304.1 GIY-YIG nuclease family protein [Perspicuibacillus lycopersici]
MEESEYYFYVLECKDGSYYGGYTVDLEKRLQAHNSGTGAKYTRGRGPVKLVYHETFSTKGDALRAEYRFKQLPRKKKEEFLKGVIQFEITKKLSK